MSYFSNRTATWTHHNKYNRIWSRFGLRTAFLLKEQVQIKRLQVGLWCFGQRDIDAVIHVHTARLKQRSVIPGCDVSRCCGAVSLVRVTVRESQSLDTLLPCFSQVWTLLLVAGQRENILLTGRQRGVWISLQTRPLVVWESHGEQRLGVAHKLVDVPLPSHLQI